MTDKPTRRALLRPLHILLVAFGSAVFASVITLMTTRDLFYIAEGVETFPITFVVFGATFIGILLIIALLLLAVDPAEFDEKVTRGVLLPTDADGDAADGGAGAGSGGTPPAAPKVL